MPETVQYFGPNAAQISQGYRPKIDGQVQQSAQEIRRKAKQPYLQDRSLPQTPNTGEFLPAGRQHQHQAVEGKVEAQHGKLAARRDTGT